MRIALFGGTFDPIHHGHLAIAAAAADRFSLDVILFAPTGRQPLKPAGATASFADRLAMVTFACQAATANQANRFQPSSLDAPRPDGAPNYTVELLAALQQQHPEATLFNLVGLDSFLDLPRWREPERLLTMAEWIVASRPGFTFPATLTLETKSGETLHLTPEQHQHIHLLDSVEEDVSATELRHRLEQGDPCLDLIPETVSTYIKAHHLYRS